MPVLYEKSIPAIYSVIITEMGEVVETRASHTFKASQKCVCVRIFEQTQVMWHA